MFTMNTILAIVIIAIGLAGAFLLGAIPWGVIIGYKVAHIDIREHGSGNIGTTNSARVMGAGPGAAVMVLDIAKGSVGVLFAQLMCVFAQMLIGSGDFAMELSFEVVREVSIALALAAVILGHLFSPFLGWKGGKGIATAFGGMLPCMPLTAALCLACFILLCVITKRVSAGSIAGAFAFIAGTLIFYTDRIPFVIVSIVMAGFILYAHRENIKRLMHGEEKKFSLGSKEKAQKAAEEEAEAAKAEPEAEVIEAVAVDGEEPKGE